MRMAAVHFSYHISSFYLSSANRCTIWKCLWVNSWAGQQSKRGPSIRHCVALAWAHWYRAWRWAPTIRHWLHWQFTISLRRSHRHCRGRCVVRIGAAIVLMRCRNHYWAKLISLKMWRHSRLRTMWAVRNCIFCKLVIEAAKTREKKKFDLMKCVGFCRREVLHETLDISTGIGRQWKLHSMQMYDISFDLFSAGWPSWRLSLCLLGSWTIVFFVICRGIKSSGKASYFLALFPYVIMFALFLRAVTLEGSGEGIMYFLTPQWGELVNPKVFYPPPLAAVCQINLFFQLRFGMRRRIKHFSHLDWAWVQSYHLHRTTNSTTISTSETE